MSEENAPIDVTAMNAEAIVRAALAWRYQMGSDPVLNTVEWRLYEACTAYGDTFKGVKGQ